MNLQDPSPDDWDDFERALANDDGSAAREHLAAGRAIYYSESDTPTGTCVKEYPDGRREIVTFDVDGGEVLISVASHRSRQSLADALAQHPEDSTSDFEPPVVEIRLKRADLEE
ncbi:hypothetical protein [Caballeronia sp. ATUFL_F1_KS39]|uniref:hypothetical protein n=1 Tax=Caballeronia sp. ATUFL_F1_KS39 TaxID=2921766 RepID=UPI002027DDBB|nr:hypothetical protein [Caballeronia sp. ATUFL_F1_KS39]